ncbi:MAG: hypothetical protein HYT31_00385 [Parcubacteria group bacterium]|nr:hypothetical protein [Parcubacteria group bacterium]
MYLYIFSYQSAEAPESRERGQVLLMISGRAIAFSVLSCTVHPMCEQTVYDALYYLLQAHGLRERDLIAYHIKTHRSHPGIGRDRPEVVRLYLRYLGNTCCPYSEHPVPHPSGPLLEAMMQRVRLTDLATVLSNHLITAGALT